MTEIETLHKAFQLAKENGDTESALKYANAIVAMGGKAQQPKPAESNWYDAPRAALQGATLGFADEIGSVLAAIPSGLATGTSPIAAYKDMQSHVNQEQKQYAKDNPGKAMGLELAGGLLTGGVSGLKAMPSLLGRFSKPVAASLLGAAEGGLYGAGAADQGERMKGGATGAAIGAVAAPVLGYGMGKVGDAVGGLSTWMAHKLSDTPRSQAERVLRKAAESEGLDADMVIAAYKKLGPEGLLADTGDNFRYMARGAADELGPFKAKARGLLESRQMGSSQRMIDAAQQTMGSNADEFGDAIKLMMKERGAKSTPLYEKAWAEGISQSDELAALLERPSMKRAMGGAVNLAKDMGDDPKDNLLKTLHYAKMSLDSRIEPLLRSGSNTKARSLITLKNELLGMMDDASPSYKEARNVFAGESSLLDAAKKGQEFFKLGADDIDELVKGMGQSEVEMFRRGSVKAIVNKLEDTELTHDAARRLINKKSLQRKFGAIFDTPDDAESFIRTAIAEREMARTRQVVTGGSMTSSNLKAGEALNQGIQPEALAALSGHGGVGSIMAVVQDIVGKKPMTPEALQELGSILLAKGVPEDEIRRMLTQAPLARYSGLLGQHYPNMASGAAAPAAVGLLQ